MTKVIIITTKICPYCSPAKKLWRELQKQYSFEYEELDATSERGQELVKRFNIKTVPTTIINDRIAFIGVPPKEKAIEAVKGE